MNTQLNKKQWGIVKTYWVVWGLKEFGTTFLATTYALFLLSRGLNLLEVNLVNVVFFVTMSLFEIPTGVVADVLGRRASVICAYFTIGAGMIVYFFADSFWVCALAEGISAIGITFMTGAFDAWAVDELGYHGYSGDTRWLFSRGQQIGKLTGLVGALIGSWLGSIDLALPWLAASAILITGDLCAIIMMQEKSFKRRAYSFSAGWKEMGRMFRAGLKYTHQSSAMRFLVVMGLAQSFSVMAPNMQWTPWFSKEFGNTTSLGFMWWGITLAIVAGSELAHRMAKTAYREKSVLVATQIAIGVSIGLTTLFKNVPMGVTLYLIHELARGMYKPLKDAYLNANIPSEQRATLISFSEMAFHIGGAAGLVVSGALAKSFGIPVAWVVSGAVLVIGTLVVARNGARKSPLRE